MKRNHQGQGEGGIFTLASRKEVEKEVRGDKTRRDVRGAQRKNMTDREKQLWVGRKKSGNQERSALLWEWDE